MILFNCMYAKFNRGFMGRFGEMMTLAELNEKIITIKKQILLN